MKPKVWLKGMKGIIGMTRGFLRIFGGILLLVRKAPCLFPPPAPVFHACACFLLSANLAVLHVSREKKRRNYTGLSLALMSAPLVQNTTGTRGKQQPSARIPVSKPVSFPEKTRKTHRLWPAASSPPGKASQRNNQCRGRVGVPGKYCNSPTHPCSKKKKKKKKSVKKSRIQTIETHFFVLLLTLDRLKKQILENKNPQKQNKNVKKSPNLVRMSAPEHFDEKKKNKKLRGKEELIIWSLSVLSRLLSARSVTPLSSVLAWGVPDLFPHCQIANRSQYKLPGCQVCSSSSRLDPAAIPSDRCERGGEQRRSHLSVNFMRDLIR